MAERVIKTHEEELLIAALIGCIPQVLKTTDLSVLLERDDIIAVAETLDWDPVDVIDTARQYLKGDL